MTRKNASARARTSRTEVARALATKHFELETGITHIFRIESKASESAKAEPIKLLEVNENTVPAGILPLRFAPNDAVPYPSVIIEITPAEFVQIKAEKLRLPEGWVIGEEIPRPKKLPEPGDGGWPFASRPKKLPEPSDGD